MKNDHRPQGGPLCGPDRQRPGCCETTAQSHIPSIGKERVTSEVPHRHGPALTGRRTAGTVTRGSPQAVDGLTERSRNSGARDKPELHFALVQHENCGNGPR